MVVGLIQVINPKAFVASTSHATCQDAEKVTGIFGENEESSRSKDDKDVEYEFVSII